MKFPGDFFKNSVTHRFTLIHIFQLPIFFFVLIIENDSVVEPPATMSNLTTISTSNTLTIATSYGFVKGLITVSLFGEVFNSFYGIPYAKSPVGELRFKVQFHFVLNCYTLFKYRRFHIGSAACRTMAGCVRCHQRASSGMATGSSDRQ